MTRSLADLTWPETERGTNGAVLVVPIGATEQHGPHLPLSTDTDIAVALANAVAKRRPDVVVAPALPYGSSGEHAGFPGTVSIGREAIELVVLELGRSAAATFERTLMICAHGGNRAPVLSAQERLRAEGRDVRAFFPCWEGDAHAGRTEMSLLLALHPARVRTELAARGETAPLAELMPQLRREGVRARSANGVLGDPAGASAVEGRVLLREALEQLVELLDGWAAP